MSERTSLVVTAPPGFVPAGLPPPPIAEGSGARVTEWSALKASDVHGDATLAFGCVATDIPGWVEDMRPAVDARSVGLVASVAERIARTPIRATANGRTDAGDRYDVIDAAAEPPKTLGTALRVIAFDGDGHVLTCFAVGIGDAPTEAVTTARLDGGRPPPPPGITLATVTYAVHHPRGAATGLGVVLGAVAVLAVMTRRKPRFRSLSWRKRRKDR